MKNRIVKLDIARTFAILCVILCHCSEMTYFNDMVVLKNLKITSRIFMMGTFTIGRFGVSIFLYLSGVLLLRKVIEKDEDIFKFYKKNLLPLIAVNEVWLIIYKIYEVFVLKQVFNFVDFIKELLLFKNSSMTNMWYMPMIIGIYIGVPFLAKIVKTFSFKSILPIMTATFIFCYIEPLLNVIARISNNGQTFGSEMSIPYMGAIYGLYLLVGYYIYDNQVKIKKIRNWHLILTAILSYVVIMCFEVYSLSDKSHYIYKVWYDFPFLLICTACLFTLFTRIDDNVINERISNIFTYISRISMGIYFVHIIVIMTKIKYMGQIFASISLETAFLTIITIILSAVIVGVLSRNKYVARYIFLIKH